MQKMEKFPASYYLENPHLLVYSENINCKHIDKEIREISEEALRNLPDINAEEPPSHLSLVFEGIRLDLSEIRKLSDILYN